MKTFKTFINENYSYSSVQVKMPDEIGKEIIKFSNEIPENELVKNGKDTRPHITIKYGLHSESVNSLDNIKLPKKITVIMGKTSLFENEENDVLKIDINSPDITNLNKIITDNTKNTNTQSGYHPHATIAYLKPGEGKKYSGDNRFKNKKITFSEIEFSSKNNDEYIKISL